jgi:hypothetical protein
MYYKKIVVFALKLEEIFEIEGVTDYVIWKIKKISAKIKIFHWFIK